MHINLPRINGTIHDSLLNDFIDSVNAEVHEDQPKLAGHAVAAIGKFLIVNHESEAGAQWLKKAAPLVEHVNVFEPMVDKLYQPIAQRANRPKPKGCAGLSILVFTPVAAGIAWWLFVAADFIEAFTAFAFMLILTPAMIQFTSAWATKYGRFFSHTFVHARTQIVSHRVWLPILATLAVVLVPFSLAADKPIVIAAVLCIWATSIIRWLTPPTILLLGVSGTSCNLLLAPMHQSLFPAKIIHLLRDQYDNPEQEVDTKLHTMFTTSRTAGRVSWEEVVMTYLHLCERVLVDLRMQSDNLDVELSMIRSSEQRIRTKVLYLIGNDTAMGLIPQGSTAKENICRTVNEALARLRDAA